MAPIEDVVILAGGRGTRLQDHARSVPKPLVEVGGQPILAHVIGIYAAQGMRRFTVLTGYMADTLAAWSAEAQWPDGIEVRCLDTGEATETGGRILQAAEALEGRPFCATYADGVADLDLEALLAAHAAHGGLATVTVVRPELQFGVAELDEDGRVRGFREKPRAEHWINGGFLCFEPGVRDYLQADSVLEREPLEALAAAGELHAYRHERFWRCLDTFKDVVALNDLWDRGEAPWRAVMA